MSILRRLRWYCDSSLTRLHISAAGVCRSCGLGLPKGWSRGHAHGANMVAVPWAVYATAAEPNVLTVQVDRERIYNAPAFEYYAYQRIRHLWLDEQRLFLLRGLSSSRRERGGTSVTGPGTAGATDDPGTRIITLG
jgi:hypothetical protein